MTTLSLAHRVLDDGQLLPPAARWVLHGLIIHDVIGIQHRILHLHQSIIGGSALRETQGSPPGPPSPRTFLLPWQSCGLPIALGAPKG